MIPARLCRFGWVLLQRYTTCCPRTTILVNSFQSSCSYLSKSHCGLPLVAHFSNDSMQPTDLDFYHIKDGFKTETETESNRETINDIDSKIPFSKLGLKPSLVHQLKRLGYHTAFDVQAKTLPHSLGGQDIIGRAVTGSGKTLAYALPIIQKLTSSKRKNNNPRAIIITPTRELCRQVSECIESLCNELRCLAVYGGASYRVQEAGLWKGTDVICATPGRFNDHIQRGALRLNNVEFLILDEADELLTPNFKDQIEYTLQTVPDTKQMMLFSATMPSNVKHVVKEYMNNPLTIDLIAKGSLVPTTITHKVIRTSRHNRFIMILYLLHSYTPKRAIIFTQTKLLASDLESYLVGRGISALSLHSDHSQRMRDTCLDRFRRGDTTVIVATDVAARGIDVPEVDLVVQVEQPPSGVDYYIHRSGRTGRKGDKGTSILLLSPSFQSQEFLAELKQLVKVEIVDPPSQRDIAKVGLKSAANFINKVTNQKMITSALPLAEELFKEKGMEALAAALVALAQQGDESVRNASSFQEMTPIKKDNYQRSYRDKKGDHRGGYKKGSLHSDKWRKDRYHKHHKGGRFSESNYGIGSDSFWKG